MDYQGNYKKDMGFKYNRFQKYVLKTLLTFLIAVIVLIGLKRDTGFKALVYKNVYESNISLASVNNLYKKYFGSPLPFKEMFKINVEPVFNEKFKYESASLYLDGAKLMVMDKYLMPALDSGMVVFNGDKEGYGKVIIVQQINGVDLWYGNLLTANVKLYDYIEKGSLIGEVNNDYLYLVFKKDGKVMDYKKYI